jgi:glycerol kinase
VLDAMNADSGVPLTALKVDGGMVYNDPDAVRADVLGVPVIRPQVAETTVFGAAYAAGLAVGFWQNETTFATAMATPDPDPNSKASTENYGCGRRPSPGRSTAENTVRDRKADTKRNSLRHGAPVLNRKKKILSPDASV